MKQWTAFLAISVLLTACTMKESRQEPDGGSGYTHSDNRSTQEGTGIQEKEMSAGEER